MNDREKMHPEDKRNLIVFVVVAMCLWFLYETYIMRPQTEALKKAQQARNELMLKDPDLLAPTKPLERGEALKNSPRVSFDSGEIYGSFSLAGGRIDDVRLHHYYKTLEKTETVELLSPSKTKEARYVDYGWVSGQDGLILPGPETIWQIEGTQKLTPQTPVTLFWENGQGVRFERVMSVDKNYLFKITQRVKNNSQKPITLHPYALISQTNIPHDFHGTWMVHEGPMGFIGDSLLQRPYNKMKKEQETLAQALTGWIGISDKYWLTALIPQQGDMSKYRFRYVQDGLDTTKDRYQVDFTGDEMSVAPGEIKENTYMLYAGAKKVLLLDQYQKDLGLKNFDLAVDFGWFWFFTYPFFLALHYLGQAVGNMGVAIILLTIVIRGATFPLTNFSYRSFAKMKKVQPQILEIREKYKDDKEKMQMAIVELYKNEGVNPFSGCLPMFLQIPIFFAFYKNLLITIELRQAPFFGWIQDLSAPDPTSLFNLFGLLPYSVPHVLMIGVWPCLMLIGLLIQKQLNPPPQDPVQREMMKFFPFFMAFLMSGFASGLVIYWTVGSFIGIIQQMIIMRSMDVPIYLFNKDHYRAEMEKKIASGPEVHPLLEMAEEQTEAALFGKKDDEVKPVSAPKPKKKKKKK